MRFALLGADDDTLELLTAIAESPVHKLVAIYGAVPALEKIIRGAAPDAQWSDEWESLLHDPVAEVVIVSTWRQRSAAENQIRADQLRKLVQAAKPLVVVQPGCESIVGFEIDMIRQDTRSLVLPYYPAGSRLPARELMDLWNDLPNAGQIEQVIVERRVIEATPDQVRIELARDVAMLGQILGRVNRVNAFGTALRAGPPRLTVHFESQSGISGQWSLATAADAPPVRTTITGSTASVVAVMIGLRQWLLSVGKTSRTIQIDDDAQGWIRRLPELIQQPPAEAWSIACRAQEVTELAERSAERGRTLELYHEEHSEEETFKGVMAVGSCAILMLTLVILVIGSIIEGIRLPYARDARPSVETVETDQNDQGAPLEPMEPPGRVWLRLWPVYPLAIFLLLQSLRLAFPKANANPRELSRLNE